MRGSRPTLLALILVLSIATNRGATPPPLLSYQGVLRDAADHPLSGDYDMTFTFWSADIGGDEIFLDQHAAAGTGAVAAANGLFTVGLGGGISSDGAGPGTYTTLAEVFRDYSEVWLSVDVAGEVLDPRSRILATAYAQNAANASYAAAASSADNADQLGGSPPTAYLTTSSAPQTKAGQLSLSTNSPGVAAIVASAYGEGGVFSLRPPFTGRATVANGHQGIVASGLNDGGEFDNTGGLGGYAYLAAYSVSGNTYGVYASGNGFGAWLNDFRTSSYSYVGYNGYGIQSYGRDVGGYFKDNTAGTYAFVGDSGYKIYGNGTNAFAQNHPGDKSRVIVYASPESSEVATYARGSARLQNGVVRVALEPTFALVTNPDIGLTAQVTPRGEWADVFVESVSATELVVRSRTAGSNASFDYQVWGLRIGFEELPPVQEKRVESPIPSMAEYRALYTRSPELRQFNALERFKQARVATGALTAPDLTRASQLRQRVHEFDATTDVLNGPAPSIVDPPRSLAAKENAEATSPAAVSTTVLNESSHETATSTADAPHTVALLDKEPRVAEQETLPCAERVSAGDLLTIDPVHGGKLVRAFNTADPRIVGIAAADAVEDAGAWRVALAVGPIVRIKIDASTAPIAAGDPLTSSLLAGYAMKSQSLTCGTIIAKALDSLEAGTGVIRAVLWQR